MAVRIVRLGAPRARGEGLRIGTVRFPPRGVPKAEYARRDYYDVWLPELAPSEGLMHDIRSGPITEPRWKSFARRYRSEMNAPERKRLLALMAALSRQTDFAVGCYCPDEAHCHRSVLRELLMEHGADVR
jgi:uncharacterized protein YeaO (DUF488 family)